MKIGTTNRGFTLVKFDDHWGQACSLQKSSKMEPDCVWLGVDQRSNLNTGELLSDSENFRMHLSQDQVRRLLPLLRHFAETGELPAQEDLLDMASEKASR